ncbi:MAG: MDR family MFS transporter [Bacteroidia bacterium]
MLSRTFALYKISFTGLSSQTWLLSIIMLINRSGTMVVPFMTLYLTSKTMGRSLGEAGTVMGIFGFGAVVGAYFGGKISDRIGFHKVQLITLFSGGIMFIVLGQIKSYPLICLCTFLLSLVNEAFRPANSSAIAFYSKPENRTRSYSLNRLAINFGWAVGGTIGGLIASFNYELLFWVDGATNICAAILLFYFLKPSRVPMPRHAKETEAPPKQSAYRDKTYLSFIFLVFLFAFCFFQLFTTIPKYFRDGLHLSEQYIGILMAVNGLIIVIFEMVLVYSLEGKKKNLSYITTGTLVCAASYLCLLLPGNPYVITLLMIVLISAGEIAAMPFMNTFWTSRSNAENFGQYAALYTIAWGGAQSLGPLICAQLAEYSFSGLFILLGGILTLAALGFYRLNKK